MDLALALLPAICFGVLVGIEIPESWRRRMFVYGIFGWRPPIFLYTLIYSIFVKMTLTGVLGSYGIFVTDIVTYPLLLIIAWRTRRRFNKEMKAKAQPASIQGGTDGRTGKQPRSVSASQG